MGCSSCDGTGMVPGCDGGEHVPCLSCRPLDIADGLVIRGAAPAPEYLGECGVCMAPSYRGVGCECGPAAAPARASWAGCPDCGGELYSDGYCPRCGRTIV